VGAWRHGSIDHAVVDERDAALSPGERNGIEALIERRGYSIPAALMSLAIELFVRVHGFVVMEAFGQLRPMVADPVATFDRLVDGALCDAGLS
jgi:hypothetical protein